MVYTEENLFQDCASSGKRGKPSVDIYSQTYEAFTTWIESQMVIGKGAHMPQFARFAWRVESEKGDSKLLRPIFILSESFGKSHNLRYKKGTPKLPGLVGCEDINYAKLAIRFTSTLSKDNVYTAMRDLVQKLGSTIADGRDVRVDFRVGRLVAKDKRVDFLFDPEFQKLVLSGDAARNARISMPMTPYGHTADTASGPSYVSRFSSRITSRATTPQVPQSPAVTQNEQVPVPEKHAAETLMNDDAVEIESAREASPEEFHIPDSTKVKDKDVLTDLVSRTLGVGSLNSTGGVSTESRKDQLADAFTHVKYPTCIPGGSPPKKSSKVKAREAVTSAAVDAAYERYGSAIEQTEEEERRREFVLRQRLDSVAAKEKYEMLKKMDEKKQLQEYLHKQIDERKSTQNSELGSPRVDSPASSTFTPVYPIEPDNGPIRERKDIEKEYLRRVLEHQVSDAKKVKDLRRQKELEADLAMLAATTEDMKASILHELQEKDEAKKALADAWARQLELKKKSGMSEAGSALASRGSKTSSRPPLSGSGNLALPPQRVPERLNRSQLRTPQVQTLSL